MLSDMSSDTDGARLSHHLPLNVFSTHTSFLSTWNLA